MVNKRQSLTWINKESTAVGKEVAIAVAAKAVSLAVVMPVAVLVAPGKGVPLSLQEVQGAERLHQ